MSNKAQFFHNVKKAKRQRLNAISEQRKYLVWIGGTHNAFNTLDEATTEQQSWINKGYTDIQIEIINEY
jgi:hypothetical protein